MLLQYELHPVGHAYGGQFHERRFNLFLIVFFSPKKWKNQTFHEKSYSLTFLFNFMDLGQLAGGAGGFGFRQFSVNFVVCEFNFDVF